MSDFPPVLPDSPPAPEPPPREPFWGYSDLLLFLGLIPISMFLGWAVVWAGLRLFGISNSEQVGVLLLEECLGYVVLFGTLALIFRIRYGRPFWQSLGWRPLRAHSATPIDDISVVVFMGVMVALAVAFLSELIRTPDTPNPMSQMVQSQSGLIPMAIFGTTVAPVCEELGFRGFLQPLLVRTLGPWLGILLTSIPFGLLHYQEYGDSWRHVVLVSCSGAAFGFVRYRNGSTKTAALMHAAYNAVFFGITFYAGK